MMLRIILATISPYRKKAFSFLGIPFKTQASNIDESFADRSDPEKLVRCLAKLKTEAVAKCNKNTIVIGMDSVGCFKGQILEKPKSKAEGLKRLKMLVGQNHQFYTGIHMINTAIHKSFSKVAKTEVWLRQIAEQEIKRYLAEDPAFKTYALGFDPKAHLSCTFIKKVEGSLNNLMWGIPLEVILEMLPKIVSQRILNMILDKPE